MLLILKFHPIFLDRITKYSEYNNSTEILQNLPEKCISFRRVHSKLFICGKYELQIELISSFHFFSFSFLFFSSISILCLIFNSWVPNVCVTMTCYYELHVWKWMLLIWKRAILSKQNIVVLSHIRVENNMLVITSKK